MTKLYVSRYSNKELSKTDAPKVGISLGDPKFKIDYEIAGKVYVLAPPRSLFGVSNKDYFKATYKKNLDRVGLKKIKGLLAMYGYGKVDEMILLCFEDITKDVTNWCHRSMFAEWWEEQTGEKVLEYPDFTTEEQKRSEKEALEKKKAEEEEKIRIAEAAQMRLF